MTSSLATDLVELLRSRGMTVATAESLTAGLCAATIADVPGASAVLRGGFIVYATDLKHSLVGVDAAVLEECGPVAGGVAKQLAEGAAQRCGADMGLGLTGVAGPDPQDGHGVGEVFVGVSVRGRTRVEKMQVEGDLSGMDPLEARHYIRHSAVNLALSSACKEINR